MVTLLMYTVAQRAEWGPGDKIFKGPLPPDPKLNITFNGYNS